MKENNLCLNSGCEALCCKNKYMFYQGKVEDSFPRAIQVSYESLSDCKQPGVFYTKFRDSFLVKIVDKCPNLGGDYGCNIQEVKPEACKNFKINSDDCKKERKPKKSRL